MSITLDLPPDLEARLNNWASEEGIDLVTLIHQIVERNLAEPTPKVWTAAELLKLSPAERDPILAVMAKDAAPLYEADLALPPHERKIIV